MTRPTFARPSSLLWMGSCLLSMQVNAAGIIHTFNGDGSGDWYGFSVGAAGDVNADGYPDLVVGANLDDNTATDSGSVRVLSGKDRAILYTFNGDSYNDQLGYSVAGAGDVNGDGYDDIIAGSHLDDNTGTDAGSARVYSGKTGLPLYTVNGTSTTNYFGGSVKGAGDVNADGYDDVVIGATGNDSYLTDAGAVRVVNGLTGATLYTFYGDSASDYMGYAVAGAGDVNADGFADIIAGATGDDNNGSGSGSARVYSGKTGAILHTFSGDSAGDEFGFSVAGAGDVNADGYADLVVSARYDDNTGSNSGSVRVFSGATGTILYTINGDSAGDLFGWSVAPAGDVNADGSPDIVVGAYADDNTGTDAGSVKIINGATGAVIYLVNGDNAADNFGYSVAGVGDVNLDGHADFLVGAPYDDNRGGNSGTARLMNGKALWLDTDGDGQNDAVDTDDDNDGVLDINDFLPLDVTEQYDTDYDGIGNTADTDDDNDGWLDVNDAFPLNALEWLDSDGDGIGNNSDTDDDNDGVADTNDSFPLDNSRSAGYTGIIYTVYGDNASDEFGGSVTTVGDVNADGYMDFAVGAQYDDNTGSNSGSVRVFSGINASPLYTLNGDSTGDNFGTSVSDAGDVNLDGYDDIIVGARYDDNTGTDSGSARVFNGATGAILYTFNGDTAYDYFGWSVAAAGDVNGDGYADVIVGAIYDDNTGTNSGSARVFSGATGAILYTLNGDSTGDNFGTSVSSAGDVNLDGYDDIIVGARYDDNTGTDSGSARVFSGATGAILYTFNGDGAGDSFGVSVSGAGDVNGDGRADIIVGANQDDNNGANSGSARVFSGATGAILYTFNGDGANDNFGYSVSDAGDVNKDGYADLIVGAYYDDNNLAADSGSMRVISGVNGAILYVSNGDSSYDLLGGSVSTAGDVDKDGYADLIVGAYYDDNNGINSGSARIYSGQSLWTDNDGDGQKDAVDADDDNDGVADINDSRPVDKDNDGERDVIDFDKDNDGEPDATDKFPLNRAAYLDGDDDGAPDAWSPGCDTICQLNSGLSLDNCLAIYNPSQTDLDDDGLGDACDADSDNDGVLDVSDKFPFNVAVSVDGDNDGYADSWNAGCNLSCQLASGVVLDNCVDIANPDQFDYDSDSIGNVCDGDIDGDDVLNVNDSYPYNIERTEGDTGIHGLLDGYHAGDAFGLSVASAGDVNGDGYPDIVVGAPYEDAPAANSGAVRVLSGLDSSVLHLFMGDSADDRFGYAVAGAGDVNDDGYADVIVGAYLDDNNGSNSGSARVYSGVDGSELYLFDGVNAEDRFGASVAAAGDVNSDGYADIVVGAPYSDNNGVQSGTVFVISGADGSMLYVLDGDNAGDYFGYSVSGAGDLNTDGYADIIVGAPYSDNNGVDSGNARVYSGIDGSVLYSMDGNSAGDELGRSVSNTGDTNMDGYDDVIVGSHLSDISGVNSGSASIYSGLDGMQLQSFNGDGSGDYFGWSVSDAGDVNSDGFMDVIVGAHLDDNNGLGSGSARVLSGADGSILYVLDGDNAGDYFGYAVSGAGDINADGYADLLVGAYMDDNNGINSGTVRIFSGAASVTDSDGDGISDAIDIDDDGDTLGDIYEIAIGTDPYLADTDKDTVNDNVDKFPLDPSETLDTDSDKVGNNTDNCIDVFNPGQIDSDADGAGDDCDAFPSDPAEDTDTDGDGVGDNADAFVSDPAEWADTDGDGTGDNSDDFPSDPAEDTDTDGDGVGDNADVFPTDPEEFADTDNDQSGNNSDNCQIVVNVDQLDTNNNGIGDACEYQQEAIKRDYAGSAVAFGDFNNDGFDDVVAGSPRFDSSIVVNGATQILKDAGRIEIYSGADGSLLAGFHGTTVKQQFGSAIAVVSDQNTDGIPDLVVGEPLFDVIAATTLRDAGRVALYSGADGALLQVIATGSAAGERFGAAVAVANGDLVVGAPRADIVVNGSTVKDVGAITMLDGLTNTVLYTRSGTQAKQYFGAAVAFDAANDDILVGSPGFDVLLPVKLTDVGRVDIFDSADGVSAALFSIEGSTKGNRFGASVASFSADIGGSADVDWVVGSPGADLVDPVTLKPLKDIGIVQVFSGLNDVATVQLDGAAAKDNFGAALAANGDINNDGTPDIAIGAPLVDTLQNGILLKDAGAVEVMAGDGVY